MVRGEAGKGGGKDLGSSGGFTLFLRDWGTIAGHYMRVVGFGTHFRTANMASLFRWKREGKNGVRVNNRDIYYRSHGKR